jgi:hypothetical protein
MPHGSQTTRTKASGRSDEGAKKEMTREKSRAYLWFLLVVVSSFERLSKDGVGGFEREGVASVYSSHEDLKS